MVTITQPTETGQVYSLAEIRALAATCREIGLRLHMDGARFANACASLNCSPAEMTWKAGVDLLCFGGTKNGMAVGEAILFFDPRLAEDFDYRCKQAGQLASKMRFLAAPWVGMLQDGAWLRNAQHANAGAARLAAAVADLADFNLMFPVEANAVFLRASADRLEALRQRGWQFYTFIGGERAFHVRLGRRSGQGRCAGEGYQGGVWGASLRARLTIIVVPADAGTTEECAKKRRALKRAISIQKNAAPNPSPPVGRGCGSCAGRTAPGWRRPRPSRAGTALRSGTPAPGARR